MILLPQGFGNHQDVAEQNRGIKPEPAHRLERHFHGQLRILHELNKGVLLLELTVFRERPTSLAHQPHRGPVHDLTPAGGEKTLAIRP